MAKKRSRQAKRLLRIFDKGTAARKSLKKAMSDKKIRKNELRGLVRRGASLKQLQRVRKQATKAKNYKVGSGADTRQEVRKVFNKQRKGSITLASLNQLKFGDPSPPDVGPRPPALADPPKKPTQPTPPAGVPDAGEVDDSAKITEVDPGQSPSENLESLAEDSNVTSYAGDLSDTLAEQAAANNMTIQQFREKMNDPAYRMRVKGIRFADRGTGGMTRSQLARRGTTGVFGRSGLRIQSLNI